MQVMADDGPAVTATGALLFGLAGLAIGPLAAAIFATGGGFWGISRTNESRRRHGFGKTGGAGPCPSPSCGGCRGNYQ